jgi:hypothetical protein
MIICTYLAFFSVGRFWPAVKNDLEESSNLFIEHAVRSATERSERPFLIGFEQFASSRCEAVIREVCKYKKKKDLFKDRSTFMSYTLLCCFLFRASYCNNGFMLDQPCSSAQNNKKCLHNRIFSRNNYLGEHRQE